jgi:hypothetical protein
MALKKKKKKEVSKRARGLDDAQLFTRLDLRRVRLRRNLKIDYSRVRNLDYIDKDNRLPQTFAEYRRIAPKGRFAQSAQRRVRFAGPLKYLNDFSVYFFKKKILVLVNQSLHPAVKAARPGLRGILGRGAYH